MEVREDIRKSGWLSPEDGGEGEGASFRVAGPGRGR